MRKLILFFSLILTNLSFGQKNIRNLLPGVWNLDSVCENGKKIPIDAYIKTIEFTLNGRILLGTGVYEYIIVGDSVHFNYQHDNNVRKLLDITAQNLVIYEEYYADLYDKQKSNGYLWTHISYYSRKLKKTD